MSYHAIISAVVYHAESAVIRTVRVDEVVDTSCHVASIVGLSGLARWITRGRVPGAIFGTSVALASCYAVYKAHKMGNMIERNSEMIDLARRYDEHWMDLKEVVETARQEDGVPLDGSANDQALGTYLRKKYGRRELMVFALAGSAYLQFGFSEKSLANMLVYRKYMRDLITQYKDLRALDAAGIIDSAIHLSFLPSPALREMSQMMTLPAFRERMGLLPGGFADRWNFWSSGLGVPTVRA